MSSSGNLWAFHALKALVLVLKEIGFTTQMSLRHFRKVYYTSGYWFRGVFCEL